MKIKTLQLFILCNLAFGISTLSLADSEFTKEETPVEIMTKACNSYRNFDQVSINAHVSVDELYEDFTRGNKYSNVEIKAKLPKMFKAESKGGENFRVLYDGEAITALDTSTNFYAQYPLKGNLHDFLLLTERLNQPTPALDIVVPKYCLDNLKLMNQGKFLATSNINGHEVKHLEFYSTQRDSSLKYQIWVDTSNERYVIRKLLLTTTYASQKLDYQYVLISKNVNSTNDDAEFSFNPDSTHKKTEFLFQP